MGINVQGLKTYVDDLKYVRKPRVPECTKLPTPPLYKNTLAGFTIAHIVNHVLLHYTQCLAPNAQATPQATPLYTMSGPECNKILASDSESSKILQIGSLNCYVSGNSDLKSAVLLISNIYGYGAPKFRKLADKVASAGYYVVVPDFFHGDPMTPETPLQDWLKNHGPVEAVVFAKSVIEALKEKGISKIGAAGFCWGGKVAVELAKEADIQVAALLHPSFITLDDIKGVKVPTAILGAEIDNRSPPELVKEFEIALQTKPEVDHFVKIYAGVSHGWTVRYKDEDAAAVRSAEEAHQDLVGWFDKCLEPNN